MKAKHKFRKEDNKLKKRKRIKILALYPNVHKGI